MLTQACLGLGQYKGVNREGGRGVVGNRVG